MISANKIQTGLAKYIDNEFLPHIEEDGVKRMLVGAAAGIAIKRTSRIIDELKHNKVVKMLGIVDESGLVDIDILREELSKNMPDGGIRIDIPAVGTLTFNKDDIDKLYSYMTATEVHIGNSTGVQGD